MRDGNTASRVSFQDSREQPSREYTKGGAHERFTQIISRNYDTIDKDGLIYHESDLVALDIEGNVWRYVPANNLHGQKAYWAPLTSYRKRDVRT